MDNHQLEGARKAEDMYPFIQSISVWRRHVEITHKESPLIVMTMQHRNKVRKKSVRIKKYLEQSLLEGKTIFMSFYVKSFNAFIAGRRCHEIP